MERNFIIAFDLEGHRTVKENLSDLLMMMMMMMVMMISKFNGTSTPKGSYSAKTVVNCCLNHQKIMSWSNECKSKAKCQVTS